MESHKKLSTRSGTLGPLRGASSPPSAGGDDGTQDMTSLDPVSSSNEVKTTHPDYVQTLKVKDANGQIKELIFPKGLDLDRPKRARTTFTNDQLGTLEKEFRRNQYLVGRERSLLASKLGLSETQVKVWYQNRRTKHKRDREREAETSSVLPPPYASTSSPSAPYFPFPPPSSSLTHHPSGGLSLSIRSSESFPSSGGKPSLPSTEQTAEIPWTASSTIAASEAAREGPQEGFVKSGQTSLAVSEENKHPEGSNLGERSILRHSTLKEHQQDPQSFPSNPNVEQSDVLDKGSFKPFGNSVENLHYSLDRTHPLSTLFGTFQSVSPTFPHSAFRPLASSRPLNHHPFYYLKPAGYPSWLP